MTNKKKAKENKFGEIKFTPNGELKEIYGYIGNGISFEYVELQEYEDLQKRVEELEAERDDYREALLFYSNKRFKPNRFVGESLYLFVPEEEYHRCAKQVLSKHKE